MTIKTLDRLLFVQGGRCFFCDEVLTKADASIEHLMAHANGGTNAEENCVACCREVNGLLGSMPLKEKIRVLMRHNGRFKCPGGRNRTVEMVMNNLAQRGDAKPKTIKTLTGTILTLCGKGATEETAVAIIEELAARRFIVVNGTKVTYS